MLPDVCMVRVVGQGRRSACHPHQASEVVAADLGGDTDGSH